jgi:hypothetical protein
VYPARAVEAPWRPGGCLWASLASAGLLGLLVPASCSRWSPWSVVATGLGGPGLGWVTPPLPTPHHHPIRPENPSGIWSGQPIHTYTGGEYPSLAGQQP